MSHAIVAHPANNITLVYDALQLASVNRDALRAVLGGEDIVAMDTPELLVMFSPSNNRVLQLGDRRVRAIDQGNRAPAQTELPLIATHAHKAVGSGKLKAYGYNYDLITEWQGSQPVEEFLRQRFLKDEQNLAEVFDGTLITFAPRFQFERSGRRYDLLVEPKADRQLKVHLNVHIEAAQLPNQNKLRASFVDEYEALTQLMARLLEG